MKYLLRTLCPITLIMAATISHAEIDEEIITSAEASAYAVESDNPFENLDTEQKIRHPNYVPENDTLYGHLFNSRHYVIAKQFPVRYYAIREGKKPKLFYLNAKNSAVFAIADAYAENREKITIQAQLPHQVKDHELFSIMQTDKNLALIFSTRYHFTPAEKKLNAAFSSVYADDRYRRSYEIIEIDHNAKQLHRVKFIAPTIENGMGFGPKYDEKMSEYNAKILEYSTKSPGNYQTVHPYDIETRYEYHQGKLKHFEKQVLLTASDKVFYKNPPKSLNYENYIDDQAESDHIESSTCLNDYFAFKDKAVPRKVKWGNEWMQEQPDLHRQFLSEYENGKVYVWKDFRKLYCDLS